MIGFRQILVILGVILLIRLIGRIMTARRNINEHRQFEKEDLAKEKARQNFGKTTIKKINKADLKDSDYTAFEEVE